MYWAPLTLLQGFHSGFLLFLFFLKTGTLVQFRRSLTLTVNSHIGHLHFGHHPEMVANSPRFLDAANRRRYGPTPAPCTGLHVQSSPTICSPTFPARPLLKKEVNVSMITSRKGVKATHYGNHCVDNRRGTIAQLIINRLFTLFDFISFRVNFFCLIHVFKKKKIML